MNFSPVSLTRALVKMHEGESKIESKEKKGTNVIVRLLKSCEAAAPSNGWEFHSPDEENKSVS